MSTNELLAYYQQELAYIRKLGAEFAAAHPQIAGRLGLNAKIVEDPHVERLIEAFAFANARIKHKLDDEFPELADALLTLLQPHFLAPIPAMAILQLQPDAQRLLHKKVIAKDSLLATDAVYGEICHFTTCYPVELWPVEVARADLRSKPLQAPGIPALANAASVLQISLRCTHAKLAFNQLAIEKLRFFINAQAQYAYGLYELLFNHTTAIVLADSLADKNPIILNNTNLQAVGFAEEEGMLPYSKRTLMGYRLLMEYFAFPEKFLFFDLANIKQPIQQKNFTAGQSLELFFYFNSVNKPLEKNLNAQFFALGCTPIVNLFEKVAEPFALTHTQIEYPVVADAQRAPEATEIYAVKKVVAVTDAGELSEYQPFYGLKHYKHSGYYHISRRPSWQQAPRLIEGTEVFLSFTDVNFNPLDSSKKIISADIWCSNRDLPQRLPFSGNEPRLYLLEQNKEVFRQLKCLTPLTTVKRPYLNRGARWRCISNLSLNYLSLANDEQGIEALRSLLRLYDFTNSDEQQALLEGLLSVQAMPAVARAKNTYQNNNLCWQGMEISLKVNAAKFSSSSVYFFGAILERFFALYTTINSFTALSIQVEGSQKNYRWPPRAGEKQLF